MLDSKLINDITKALTAISQDKDCNLLIDLLLFSSNKDLNKQQILDKLKNIKEINNQPELNEFWLSVIKEL